VEVTGELVSNAELSGGAHRAGWEQHEQRWHRGQVAQRVGTMSGCWTLGLECFHFVLHTLCWLVLFVFLKKKHLTITKLSFIS
jgi:hypothetical protein